MTAATQGLKKTKRGTAWGDLKWEYHIQTMYTGSGMWYFAAPGCEPPEPPTGPEFSPLIRSYRAGLRARVGRSTEERAAVDWAQVIADATNGITADFIVQMNPSAG